MKAPRRTQQLGKEARGAWLRPDDVWMELGLRTEHQDVLMDAKIPEALFPVAVQQARLALLAPGARQLAKRGLTDLRARKAAIDQLRNFGWVRMVWFPAAPVRGNGYVMMESAWPQDTLRGIMAVQEHWPETVLPKARYAMICMTLSSEPATLELEELPENIQTLLKWSKYVDETAPPRHEWDTQHRMGRGKYWSQAFEKWGHLLETPQ